MHGAVTVGLFEFSGKIIFARINIGCEVIESKIFGEMFVDVFFGAHHGIGRNFLFCRIDLQETENVDQQFD